MALGTDTNVGKNLQARVPEIFQHVNADSIHDVSRL
jgi:hypothetical protein